MKPVVLQLTLPVLEPENCEGCGLCCENNGSPVLLYTSRRHNPQPHPHRPPRLPQELIDEIDLKLGGLFRGQEPQARCIWFDPELRRCRHYEWRPAVCREYELGGVACLSERRPYVTSPETSTGKDPA